MYIAHDDDGDEIRLGTCTEIADILGVATNQVFMWSSRRTANGFPEEHSRHRARNGLKDVPHYDIDACRAWHLMYTPNKGGYRQHRRTTAD